MKLDWKPDDGLEDLILKALMATLWECEGNKSIAAEKLKVAPRTIANWINKYHLDLYKGNPPRHTIRKIADPVRRKGILSSREAEVIRNAYKGRGCGPTYDDLAKRFRVSATTIRAVLMGRRA